MSANGSSADASQSSANRRFLWRPKVRNTTLVLPRTGERVHRVFTLRDSPLDDDGPSDDRTPLLGGSAPTRRAEGRVSKLQKQLYAKSKEAYAFWTSKTGVGILKCSLAYLLGSLATFVPFIANTLGRNDTKHMVATVTVYFHPARSAGSMENALCLAICAFIYAAFVSFSSMAVSAFFGHHYLIPVGHAIVLIVFCGGGLGLIAWTKQRLGNPLVNVACSLASLSIISILTKEGAVQESKFSYEKILQILKMVLIGIVMTTFVSFVIKPISARHDFREDLVKTTDLLADFLSMISRSFLSGSDEELKSPAYEAASQKYTSAFNSLTKNLGESKWEHYLFGTEKEYRANVKVTKCVETISQDLRGLRSAASTQFSLMEKSSRPSTPPRMNGATADTAPFSPGLLTPNSFDPPSMLSSIYEEPEEEENEQTTSLERRGSALSLDAASTSADIFSLFISNLGPPMKSLAYTLKEVLGELPFDSARHVNVNSHFRGSLVDANALYTNARKDGLSQLYRNRSVTKWRSEKAADFEDVAASCGYFSSSLQDLAEHTIHYLDVLEEMKGLEDRSLKKRSWNWLKFWRMFRPASSDGPQDEGIIHRHATPEEGDQPPKERSIRLRMWQAFRFIRREDIRFAIKVGIGAVLFGMFAFIPSTRPIYNHWRAEWGLLSYMLVCSMTVGASNTTGFERTWGTCAGALCGVVAWVIADDNPWALGFIGWLMAVFAYYIILGLGKGPMGRFILLTYNLSVLYSYSLTVRDQEDDDDEGGIDPAIWEIVLHRVVAVTVGTMWGMIVTRLIWPISARKKFQNGLSVLWLRMGLIWKRDPLSILMEGEPGSSYMDIRESIELQRFLSKLDGLRDSAAYEFDLRGPFPKETFGRILKATGRILDAFYAMNVVIVKDLKATPGEAEILKYTRNERMQLSSRISHLFSVLASSMKLEYPLNDALPNIEHTRDRLLAKLFQFRTHMTGQPNAPTDEDYELFYAYSLVTGQLAQDIGDIGRDIEQLYGVLNEDSLKLQ
ncbi:hypothetical protein NA57DRAFT_64244 [Rhizodiscina lignyota]|uniref:Integral membrane bound transporter domain-containing protein n=1 Tax=Rhizodiscina lignyota TaxID=1504668 RepID=A0A9P4IGT9_9PEZI|nr:hypothetical protein NA57DRAFT_64244 [Rhizodiscina lignyota]